MKPLDQRNLVDKTWIEDRTAEDEAFAAVAAVAKTKDWINPDHYKIGGIETIDYMQAKSTPEEFVGHLRLTALKYLSRVGSKDDALQEYKKAQWYINRLVNFMEAK